MTGTVVIYEHVVSSRLRWPLVAAAPLGMGVFVASVLVQGPPSGWSGLGVLPAAAALILVHELAHAAVMVLAGARPKIGFDLLSGRGYCEAVGHRFTRRAWVAALLAPLAVTVPLGLLLLTRYPTEMWALAVAVFAPLAALRDVEYVVRTLRWADRHDLIEERSWGFAVVRPLAGPSGVDQT